MSDVISIDTTLINIIETHIVNQKLIQKNYTIKTLNSSIKINKIMTLLDFKK